MKKGTLIILIAVIAIALAILTNPKEADHKAAAKKYIDDILQEQITNETDDEWQALGLLFGKAVSGFIIENIITSENYIIFSTTHYKFQGEDKTIGFGLFGKVFITNKIKEEIKKQQAEQEV